MDSSSHYGIQMHLRNGFCGCVMTLHFETVWDSMAKAGSKWHTLWPRSYRNTKLSFDRQPPSRAFMSESLHDDMKVSLVIPVRNEESTLRNLIATIHRQLRQPDEIILVDGGSTDGTISLARQLTADDPRYKV